MYDYGPQVVAKNSDWFIVLFAPVHMGSVNYLINYLQIIDQLITDKSRYFAQPRSIIVLSFDHRSFDQLNVSNHSLPARETDPPFSHKSVVSITHEQNIICS